MKDDGKTLHSRLVVNSARCQGKTTAAMKVTEAVFEKRRPGAATLPRAHKS